jgi:hypothetical protein
MGMKRFAYACGVVGVSAAALMGLAGVAQAAPAGPGSASDVVQSLRDQGYDVMLNGTPEGPLSQCTVTGIHNPDASGHVTQFTTVYVDVSCPRTDN